MRTLTWGVVIAGVWPSFGCMHEASNAGAHALNAHEGASLADLGPVPRGSAQVCEARVHVAVPGHADETSAQPIAPARL